MFRGFFSALLPCRGWHVPRRRQPSPVPHTSLISSYSYCVLFPQLRTRHSSRYYRLSRVPVRWQMKGVLLVPSAGSPFGNRCRVSFWGPMQGVFPVTEEGSPPGVQAGAPFGGRWRVSVREPMKSVLEVADGGSPPGGEAGTPFGGR